MCNKCTMQTRRERVDMNEYYKKLKEHLENNEVKCACGCTNIGIDNWGMFKGERDWFYYCKECDDTFIE